MQVHPCKIEIVDDPQKHRGAGASFMWMLQRVESDYYMFCDQDDKWLPDKVKDTYARMQEVESQHPDVPVLIHTDLSVCDGSLNVRIYGMHVLYSGNRRQPDSSGMADGRRMELTWSCILCSL